MTDMLGIPWLAAHIHERLTTGKWKLPKGWDARDPAGCWTHDLDHSAPIDYCDGFKMFDTFQEAKDYADTLEFSLIKFETFKHGGEDVSKWTVERFEAFYG